LPVTLWCKTSSLPEDMAVRATARSRRCSIFLNSLLLGAVVMPVIGVLRRERDMHNSVMWHSRQGPEGRSKAQVRAPNSWTSEVFKQKGYDLMARNTTAVDGASKAGQPAVIKLREEDLPEAERIFRLAFGTFIGVPEPETFWADRDYVLSPAA
jgi:hypothetical protein